MENTRKIIASIDCQNEADEEVLKLAAEYDINGADMLYVYNYAKSFEEREKFISLLRKLRDRVDLPIITGVFVDRLEDVKKAYYSGAAYVAVDMEKISDKDLLAQAVTKIGKDKVFAVVNFGCNYKEETLHEIGQTCLEYIGMGIGGIIAKHVTITPKVLKYLEQSPVKVIIRDALDRNTITQLMELPSVAAVATNYYEGKNIFTIKNRLVEQGIISPEVKPISFADMKKNEQGMVPVIVQDYKTNQVLMLAYMNEEAYNKTLETGRMTYYSRSRQELWIKGETSGHFQYVKSLSIDCDSDTLLAKVKQVGAACHTGNYSCFYTDILKSKFEDNEIATVLDKVMGTIMDRKVHPKEGSYTNYLFDKGIDKILKKCGEEATEMVIAAKNPDAEELRYEIADFLYHMMVLMAECNLTWEDVARELASRE